MPPRAAPLGNRRRGSRLRHDKWELYHLEEDFSQAVDLAEKEPAKLRELQDLFMAEAAKYNVLPLDDRFAERMDVTLRPGFFTGRDKVTFYPGMTRLPEGSGPKLVGVPFTMTAPVEIPKEGAEGVIFAVGGDAAGFSLFLWEGKVRFHYNFFAIKRYDVMSPDKLSPGKHTIEVAFTPEAPKPGTPAKVALSIDGKTVAEAASMCRCPCASAQRRWTSAWIAYRPYATITPRRACSRSPARSNR